MTYWRTDYCKLFLSGEFFFNWFALCSYTCLLLHYAFIFFLAGVLFFKLAFWKYFAYTTYAFLFNVQGDLSFALFYLVHILSVNTVIHYLQQQLQWYKQTCFYFFRNITMSVNNFLALHAVNKDLICDYFRIITKSEQRGLNKLTSNPPIIILVNPGLTAALD